MIASRTSSVNALPPISPYLLAGEISLQAALYEQAGTLGEGANIPFGMDAQEGVAEWAITSVGRRPTDFMVRDLLHALLLRNRLPTRYHQMIQKPPPWMLGMASHLPPEVQAQAHQHLALDYQHRQHLARLLPAAEEEDEHFGESNGFYYIPLIEKLRACWPHGVEVSWEGEGLRTPRDVCRNAWLCPWCFGRRVAAMPRLETPGDPPPPDVLLDENIVARARALRIDRQPQKRIQCRIDRSRLTPTSNPG